MLEPVSLHQNRFNTPGIVPDARGILLGKQGAVLFGGIDSLVGWLRVLSDEMPLDDILPSLAIQEVRSAVQSLAFLVVFQAESSHVLDHGARIARLLGGLAFTGSGKHLIKYRDARSPLGYDVDEVSSEPGDFVLYDHAFTQAYRRVRDVPFSQVVFRLSLQRLPGRDAEAGETLWLAVVPGLSRAVLAYLHRNRVPVAAAMVEREGARSAFGEARGAFPSRYLIARVQRMPERMCELFARVPGVDVFRSVADNAVVELGFRHPLRLESCRAVFPKERFYLFSGSRDAVDVIAGPMRDGALALVEGERLIAVGFDLDAGPAEPPSPAYTTEPPPIRVALRLVPSTAPPRRVRAALLGWRDAERLKRLAFALPPTMLSGCRVAPILDGLLIICPDDTLPLGEPYYEVARSVYAPLGFEFLPRVSEELLLDHVGGVDGRRIVFKRGAARPIAIPESVFEPLSRRVLGRLEVDARERDPRGGQPFVATEGVVVNDPAGLLPLWGYRRPPGSSEG